MEGKIPAELQELEDLIYLDLSSNKLTGHVPPELSKLTKLGRSYMACILVTVFLRLLISSPRPQKQLFWIRMPLMVISQNPYVHVMHPGIYNR